MLRTEDNELLYTFRFFIMDLCVQLEHEREQLNSNETIIVYHGQCVPKEESTKLNKEIGSLISMNGFLSTSCNIDTALIFARHCVMKVQR